MLQPGNLIAKRFLVERAIGSGGMGQVFLVRHQSLDERFALKVLHQREARDSTASARFQREARAAAGLRCEHTVRVIDFGHLDDGQPFLVMEFIEGQSLAALLRGGGPLPVPDAVRAILHACAALAEAHAVGVIHRDIKPANLLLSARSDGSPLVKLADFGIAKLQKAEFLTETHASLGSPAYMAPEQIRDARAADPRSDVWSLGVTLYELLAGQTPFHAFTAPGILSRVLTEEPTPLQVLRPEVPAPVIAAVEGCLQKDPTRRFSSVLELADALAPLAPEPGEDARIRRIAAHARRSPPEPPPLTAPVEEQITDATTSLTQAPGSSAPDAPQAPRVDPPAPGTWRALLLVAAFAAALLGWRGLSRRPPEVAAAPPAPVASLLPAASSLAGAPLVESASPEPSPSAPPPAPPASVVVAPKPALSAAPPKPTAPRPAPRPAASPASPPRAEPHPLGEFGPRQ